MSTVYDWPELVAANADGQDIIFAGWAQAVRHELDPVYKIMRIPLPDDPVRLDEVVTQDVDGWLPRVASLAVLAEYHLNAAKERKWPPHMTADGGSSLS